MGIRNIEFANGEYYHVFNRGVDKRIIFNTKAQQTFFFNRLWLLNTTDNRKYIANKRSRYKDQLVAAQGDQLVSIVAYCLLPNHYHLLLKQEVDNGISQFMQRLGTSYTMFFNQQNNRSGSLFQGKFKAKHLGGDFALPTLSAYVNLNNKHHNINPADALVKSSLGEYLDIEQGRYICNSNEINSIISEAGGADEYKIFIKHASLSFADNKNQTLSINDFEF
ncbi:transposase [Candidatus Thioglobus sp.]|uniref:transposase n=1 Tax=Candidatus Thioglobus sp. TaxID=2026721 RepID=UPI003D0C51A6